MAIERMTDAQANNLRRWELDEREWEIARQLRDILQVSSHFVGPRRDLLVLYLLIRALPSALLPHAHFLLRTRVLSLTLPTSASRRAHRHENGTHLALGLRPPLPRS